MKNNYLNISKIFISKIYDDIITNEVCQFLGFMFILYYIASGIFFLLFGFAIEFNFNFHQKIGFYCTSIPFSIFILFIIIKYFYKWFNKNLKESIQENKNCKTNEDNITRLFQECDKNKLKKIQNCIDI